MRSPQRPQRDPHSILALDSLLVSRWQKGRTAAANAKVTLEIAWKLALEIRGGNRERPVAHSAPIGSPQAGNTQTSAGGIRAVNDHGSRQDSQRRLWAYPFQG